MDIVLASTGAVTPCEVAVHELESLPQLHLAISKLTALPVASLVLFLADGRELGEDVFTELWERGGAERERERIILFDRGAFTADPEGYAAREDVVERMVLDAPLPARPPVGLGGDFLAPLRANHARAHEVASRSENMVDALRVAGGNLGEHLAGLEVAVGGAEGNDSNGKEARRDTHRRRRRSKTDRQDDANGSASGESDGSSSAGSSASSSSTNSRAKDHPPDASTSWKALIEVELARERRLLGMSPSSSSPRGSPTTETAGPSSRGYQRDLANIDSIPVFGCFPRKDKRARAASGSGSGSKGKERAEGTSAATPSGLSKWTNWNGEMLGVHVRQDAMRVVHESCRRIYDDHAARYDSLLGSLDALREDTAHVGALIEQLVNEVEGEMGELLGMADRDMAEAERLSHEELDVHWESLCSLDVNIREQLQAIVDLKNDFTLQFHILLRDISVQQSTIASLPTMLTALEETLVATRTNSKTGFPHLDRLRHMLYAYGSACIEVLWRKSTHDLLLVSSGRIAEDTAELLQRERTRRERFETRELELLPWKSEMAVFKGDRPDLQMTTHGGAEVLKEWDLSEEDVAELLALIEELAKQGGNGEDEPDLDLLRTKRRLDKRLASMRVSLQRLERVVANRAKLPGGAINYPNGHHDSSSQHEGNDAIKALKAEHAAAISLLETELATANAELPGLRERITRAENDKSRQSDELTEHQRHLEEKKAANGELTSKLEAATQRSAELATDLEESRRRIGDLENAREADLAQIQMLQGERSQLLSGLGDARSSEDQLAAQLTGVQAELAATLVALEEAQADRDHALRDQSATAERLIRDHLTEADGDRAVLEHQNVGLSKEVEELKARIATEVTTARNQSIREIDGLKAELGMAKAQLREAQRVRIKLQDEVNQGKDALTFAGQETKRQIEIGRDAIRVASSFHECVARLHSAIKSSVTLSGSSVLEATPETTAKPVEADAQVSLSASPDADESEVALLHELAALKTYDLAEFDQDVMRTMSLVKKWQRNCRLYRDKARDKLALGQFAKGDLALFLPTSNSAVRSWAAFNIASPHHFLRPSPEMESEIKVRDWIVARIVKIDEEVVDSKRPGSNPYELAEGIRFFVLHVERYTAPPPPRKRRSSSGNTLENASTSAPLPSVSSTIGETPRPLERTQGDYFSAPTVPEPQPSGRVVIGPETLSPMAVPAGQGLASLPRATSPRFAGADPSMLPFATARRPSSGAYPDPPLLGSARRPPSVASSNGSFRQGIQYAASAKAAPTSGVSRPSAEARSPSSARVILVDENPFGPEARALSTSPSGPAVAPSTSSLFRPRLGSSSSQKQSGLAAPGRRDTGPTGGGPVGETPRQSSVGLQNALDILKQVKTQGESKGKGKE